MLEKYTSESVFHHTISGNEYAYFKKGKGDAVLIIHGFPDNAVSWTKVMNDLALAGCSVVVPFLKGYYPSSLSHDGSYSVVDVAKDMLDLMSDLGHEKFTLIGHDWGGSIAYTISALEPERVTKLITAALPHPRALKPSLKLIWQVRHFVIFQFRLFSNWYSRRNNFAYIDYIYEWWSPVWKAPAGYRQMMKDCFSEPGYLDAALGYYRSLGKDARNKEKQRISSAKTTVPTMVLLGDSDGAVDLSGIKNLEACFTNEFRFEVIKGAGHFPHKEKPEIFTELILDFLNFT